MPVKIDGSVAVVTGAGSGIGRSIAAALASAGASVVAGDIDAGSAAETAAMIGGVAAAADAASTDGIATLLDTARRTFGPVDIYVANAGITGQPGLGDDEAAWDRIIDINLRAHIRAAKAVVPEWLERGSGHFVAVASAAGLLTQLGAAPYSVTKHAAVGFAEWLAITYGDKGIGVSCVCPMGVDTPLLRGMSDSPDAEIRVAGAAVTSAGAVIDPDTVAALVVQAIADQNVPGAAPPRGADHVSAEGRRLRPVDRRDAPLPTHPGLITHPAGARRRIVSRADLGRPHRRERLRLPEARCWVRPGVPWLSPTCADRCPTNMQLVGRETGTSISRSTRPSGVYRMTLLPCHFADQTHPSESTVRPSGSAGLRSVANTRPLWISPVVES